MLPGSPSSHLAVAAPVGELIHLERLSALDQVGQVKVANIVADDYVRVCLNHQVSPPLQNSIRCRMLYENRLNMLSMIKSTSACAHADGEVDPVGMRPPVEHSMQMQEQAGETGLASALEGWDPLRLHGSNGPHLEQLGLILK